MEIKESLAKIDKPIYRKYDIHQEIERIVKRHERQLKILREHLPDDVFKKATITATETFKRKLKAFLSGAGAGNLYQQAISFLTGKIYEIINPSAERNTQT